MNIFRKILGVVVIILGILLGLYVGVWVFQAGGAIQIARSLNPLDEIGVAVGTIKMWCSWLGYTIGFIGYTIGTFIYGVNNEK